jgi:hypothetical protein
MALTLIDSPRPWSPRGQRLIYAMTSTSTAQPGFRVQAAVYKVSTAETFTFMLSLDPTNQILYDLGSLVNLRNYEDDPDLHSRTGFQDEPAGSGFEEYTITFTEYWLVSGVLTPNGAGAINTDAILVNNGYFQMRDGYSPNTNTGSINVKYALTSAANSRAMSDRFASTHTWTSIYSAYSGNPTPLLPTLIQIPVREADYGLILVPGTDGYLTSNVVDKYRVNLYDNTGTIHTFTTASFPNNVMIQLGVYPANLNDDPAATEKPSMYPDWRYYVVEFLSAANLVIANRYLFYNAELYGQWDCRYTPVRLAWVNSRGGWDYFNFIKKNEITNSIERKQYKQTRWRSTSPFYLSSDRVLTDRETIVTQSLSVTSDWLQENEYVFLRSLLVSNQVHIVQDDGTFLPASIEDTSFLERRERNGKLYNLQLRVKYSQDYWT